MVNLSSPGQLTSLDLSLRTNIVVGVQYNVTMIAENALGASQPSIPVLVTKLAGAYCIEVLNSYGCALYASPSVCDCTHLLPSIAFPTNAVIAAGVVGAVLIIVFLVLCCLCMCKCVHVADLLHVMQACIAVSPLAPFCVM